MSRLYKGGYSIRSITDLFGCYPSTVKRRIGLGKKIENEKTEEERRRRDDARIDETAEEICGGEP